MRKPALIVALAACCAMLAPAAPFAAQPEQAGPPLSAAPPKPAPPLSPAPPKPASASPAAKAPQHSAAADEAAYERCLDLAKSDPGAARDMAEGWQSRGGAHPADHCYAVALIGLKQYKEGAARLEALAQAMIHAPNSLRAEVLDQASQAWLLAGDASRAYAADTAALGLLPGDPDILIDRAEASGNLRWFDKALADLDRVLKTDPSRVAALVYRATAYRQLGKFDEALADIARALELSPDSVAALLERGDILRLKGDDDGARKDWVRVSQLAPGSDADAEAKTNIERLELKQNAGASGNK